MGRLILVGGSGVFLACAVVLLARRGRLSMRYTLGWLFVAFSMIVGGIFGTVVDDIAAALDVEPVTVMLTAVVVGALSLAVQLSISVSGLIESIRTLAESNAILEARLRAAEQRLTSVGVEIEELEDGGNES
jgi:hypothetical protein